jgi:hypothetical protein
VHHAGEVVEAADVGDALVDFVAVVVDPLDEDVAGGDVVRLAPAPGGGGSGGGGGGGIVLVEGDLERGEADAEGKGGLEGGLGLAVEVDAQLLERGRVGQLRVDARRGVFQQRELGEVALGAVEEVVRPCALEGGDLGGREEGFKAVVEVCVSCVSIESCVEL